MNVSVRRSIEGAPLGTRCEVKNLNGLRFLVGAIGQFNPFFIFNPLDCILIIYALQNPKLVDK